MGLELAGIVARVGSGCTRVKVGERVAGLVSGTYDLGDPYGVAFDIVVVVIDGIC